MYTTKTYKYKIDGITYIGDCNINECEILDTLIILNAEEGCDLIRVQDNETVGPSVWLKDEDSKDNYKEVESVRPTIQENHEEV